MTNEILNKANKILEELNQLNEKISLCELFKKSCENKKSTFTLFRSEEGQYLNKLDIDKDTAIKTLELEIETLKTQHKKLLIQFEEL